MHQARGRHDQVAVVVADRGGAAVLAPDFGPDGFADHGDQGFGAFGLGGGFFLGAAAAAAAEESAAATSAASTPSAAVPTAAAAPTAAPASTAAASAAPTPA